MAQQTELEAMHLLDYDVGEDEEQGDGEEDVKLSESMKQSVASQPKPTDQQVQDEVHKLQAQILKPRIALFGKSGAGKSTLVNNVFCFELEALAQVSTSFRHHNYD